MGEEDLPPKGADTTLVAEMQLGSIQTHRMESRYGHVERRQVLWLYRV